MKLPTSILGAFLFLVQFNSAQSGQMVDVAAIDAIFEEWNSTHTPGGVVGVFQDGELILSRAYGMASLEYDIPNSVETVFNIASVSKQFTAFSLVLLEQQGKLDLDDEVSQYFSEFPDFGASITIRHLLNHTSGLRNFQNMLYMAGWRRGDAMTNEDLVRYVSQQEEQNFPPGSEYLYCNTGFNLSAQLVERLTGQSFQKWTKKNIFEPLGMSKSGFREDLEVVHKQTATSYDGSAERGFRQPRKYWTYMGNGNLYTTVGDLAKWLRNFKDSEVGGPAAIARLQERGVLNDGDTLSYALGVNVGTYRGLKRLQHGGSVGGYRSHMSYFPEEDFGVIVLSNFSAAGPSQKAGAVIDLLLEEAFTAPKPPRSQRPPISKTPVKIDAKLLEPIAGTYWILDGGGGMVVNVKAGTDRLLIEQSGEETLTAMPTSDSTFYVKEIDATFMTHRNAEGRIERLTVFAPDRATGYRVDPDLLDPGNLRHFVGNYHSSELTTTYEVELQDDKLIVKHSRHEPFSLTPIGRDRMIGGAWFFSQISVERSNTGTITGLRVSNGRVRNLLFTKL